MSGGGESLVSIPLRDGTRLSVTPLGIQLGDRFFELTRVQDARQVAPDPETVALRIAGAGLVEFQPARPGDGAVALEALFRLRPDLLPAGFAPPSGAPVYPPPPPPLYPPSPGYPLPPALGASLPMGGYPPPGYGLTPGAAPHAVFGLSPNARQGELTPYPRTFGDILSAIFQLFAKHFRKWLTLGVLVAFVPAFLSGVLQIALYLAFGLNPWGSNADLFPASSFTTTASGDTITLPFHLPASDQLVMIVLVALAVVVLSIVFGAWQIGTLAVAARAAILGHEVRIGESLAGGLKRLFPILGTSILVGLVTLVCYLPGFVVVFALALTGSITASGSASSVTAAVLSAVCITFLVFIGCGVVALFFGIRLGYAPYVASVETVGPGTAVARSWRYAAGVWWRTFGIVLILGIIIGLAGAVAGQFQLVSVAATALFIVPLLTAVSAPLHTLGWMVLWYDLRLRREGYAAVTQTATTPVGVPPQELPPT